MSACTPKRCIQDATRTNGEKVDMEVEDEGCVENHVMIFHERSKQHSQTVRNDDNVKGIFVRASRAYHHATHACTQPHKHNPNKHTYLSHGV